MWLFYFTVPKSVTTSAALLMWHSSQRPYLQPHPTWQIVGGLPSRGHTLHCCGVTLVVFRDARLDSAYTGHPLLCPLLTKMIVKLQSQTEWAFFPPESRLRLPWHPSTIWDSLMLRALIRTASGKNEAGTLRLRSPQEHGMKGYRNCDFYAMINEDDSYWGLFRFETTWLGHRSHLMS